MGQYHKIVNLDRREYIDPHKLGAGLKQWEQLANHPSTGAALLVLLASHSTGSGGGDFATDHPGDVVGRWRGDRLAMVGDYDDGIHYVVGNPPKARLKDTWTGAAIYEACDNDAPASERWLDLSNDVARVIERELDGRYTVEPQTCVDQDGKRTTYRDGWRHFIDSDRLAAYQEKHPTAIFPTDKR